MSTTLERPRADSSGVDTKRRGTRRIEVEAPSPRRRAVVDRTLMAVGVVLGLLGAYWQLAPNHWLLAQVSDAYQLASFTFGGLAFGSGAALYADRTHGQPGLRAALAPTAAILALTAFVVAIIAALVWAL